MNEYNFCCSYEKKKDLTIEHRTLDNRDVLGYASHIPKKNVEFTVKDDIVLDKSKHVVSSSGKSKFSIESKTAKRSGKSSKKDVPPMTTTSTYSLKFLNCAKKQRTTREAASMASALERGTTDTLLAKVETLTLTSL